MAYKNSYIDFTLMKWWRYDVIILCTVKLIFAQFTISLSSKKADSKKEYIANLLFLCFIYLLIIYMYIEFRLSHIS